LQNVTYMIIYRGAYEGIDHERSSKC
jgi:hypothetical protein